MLIQVNGPDLWLAQTIVDIPDSRALPPLRVPGIEYDHLDFVARFQFQSLFQAYGTSRYGLRRARG
jgi:hypothetical protein